MRRTSLLYLLAMTACGCDQMNKTTSDANRGDTGATSAQSAPRDNSAVNVRDRDSASKTPFDQNENQQDINITANIRKRLVDTKISTNAQNVKVITQSGMVTLRGPVESAEEKKRVEEIANAVAGIGKVVNQLEVQ